MQDRGILEEMDADEAALLENEEIAGLEALRIK